jgi:hypothetical protein
MPFSSVRAYQSSSTNYGDAGRLLRDGFGDMKYMSVGSATLKHGIGQEAMW